MAGPTTCTSCEAQRWNTHYEGGTVCRTCHLFTDLQVATHIIRRSQPHMLSLRDSALADARTLAHRIVNQDCYYAIENGTTRATLPNKGRIRSDGALPILDHGHADYDQAVARKWCQPSGPHGKGGQPRSPISYDTIPSTPLSSGSAIRCNTIPTQPMSAGNPFAGDTKSPASSNPYSQESQRKFGNAIAMVAHAIGEGTRALSEGTSYEQKPLVLHCMGSSPEALQI